MKAWLRKAYSLVVRPPPLPPPFFGAGPMEEHQGVSEEAQGARAAEPSVRQPSRHEVAMHAVEELRATEMAEMMGADHLIHELEKTVAAFEQGDDAQEIRILLKAIKFSDRRWVTASALISRELTAERTVELLKLAESKSAELLDEIFEQRPFYQSSENLVSEVIKNGTPGVLLSCFKAGMMDGQPDYTRVGFDSWLECAAKEHRADMVEALIDEYGLDVSTGLTKDSRSRRITLLPIGVALRSWSGNRDDKHATIAKFIEKGALEGLSQSQLREFLQLSRDDRTTTLLLEKGVRVFRRGRFDDSNPLYRAVLRGDLEQTEIFLDYLANAPDQASYAEHCSDVFLRGALVWWFNETSAQVNYPAPQLPSEVKDLELGYVPRRLLYSIPSRRSDIRTEWDRIRLTSEAPMRELQRVQYDQERLIKVFIEKVKAKLEDQGHSFPASLNNVSIPLSHTSPAYDARAIIKDREALACLHVLGLVFKGCHFVFDGEEPAFPEVTNEIIVNRVVKRVGARKQAGETWLDCAKRTYVE